MILIKFVPFKRNSDFSVALKVILEKGRTIKEKFVLMKSSESYYPSYKILRPACFNNNLVRNVPNWEIPFFNIQEDEDHFTDSILVKEYFGSLQACFRQGRPYLKKHSKS